MTALSPAWETALAEWEAWCRASGHAANTIVLRRYQLRWFAEHLGVDDPWQLTLQQMVTFLGSHEWEPTTRQMYRQTLRSLFAFATDYGYVTVDPTTKLPKVRVPPREPRPTPDKVFQRAMGKADDQGRLILMLAAFAGLRRMEIAALRWEQIGATGLLIKGKGGRKRTVPLLPVLRAELDAERNRRDAGRFGSGFRYRERPGSPYVFPGRHNGHLTVESIGRIATGLLGGGYTCHTLRHRFATRAYAGQRDLIAVQKLLGHADISTTTVYAAHPSDALEQAVLAAGE